MAKYSIPQLRRKQTEIRNITNKLNQAQSACKVTSDQLLNVWTGDGADAFRTYYGKVDANISIMVSGCMALDNSLGRIIERLQATENKVAGEFED